MRIWWPRFIEEAWNIGAGSLFIVLLISAFAGAVTALQTGYQFTGSIPYYVVGTLVVVLHHSGAGPGAHGADPGRPHRGALRGGAGHDARHRADRRAREPGALAGVAPGHPARARGAAHDPGAHDPRQPVRALLSGWISVKAVLPVTDADFIYGAQHYWRPWDAYYSVIKAFFFAGSITIISCYMGFNTQQGAEGVGKSTTTAVVTSSVLILVLDTVLTRLLLNQ